MPGARGGRQDESGCTRPTEMPLGGSASPVRPLGRRAAASAKHERNTGSGPGERARSVQRVWNRPETASRDLGFWGWRRSALHGGRPCCHDLIALPGREALTRALGGAWAGQSGIRPQVVTVLRLIGPAAFGPSSGVSSGFHGAARAVVRYRNSNDATMVGSAHRDGPIGCDLRVDALPGQFGDEPVCDRGSGGRGAECDLVSVTPAVCLGSSVAVTPPSPSPACTHRTGQCR